VDIDFREMQGIGSSMGVYAVDRNDIACSSWSGIDPEGSAARHGNGDMRH
jgi:hypothetical protein